MDFQAAVAAGTAILDKIEGPAWRQKINQNTLDLGNKCKCVLGQLYGDFDHLSASLCPRTGWTMREMRAYAESRTQFNVQHGFDVPILSNDEEYKLAYESLTQTWLSALQRSK